ncbi:hypothetical protein DPMN_149766 [Dreissena polymorpha]|uniref:RING-type domain-containing protein n=1 Tax=Dreissena polymorpha TaxID=45954 RepID=A0A9D4FF17_DREPO|nr:hypothetical protein DPMN_149766 [Dreissena polymorpha]
MIVFLVCSFLLLSMCTTLLSLAFFSIPGFLYNFCTFMLDAIEFLIHLVTFGFEVLILVGGGLLDIIDGFTRGGQGMGIYVYRAAETGSKLVQNFVYFVQHVVANYGGYFIAAWAGFLAFWANLISARVGNHQTRAEEDPEEEDVDDVQREHAADARNERVRIGPRNRLYPDLREFVGDRGYEQIVDNNDTYINDRPQNARVECGALRNRNVRNDVVGDVNHSDFDHHDDRLCVVCLDRTRTTAVFPCGHTHMCELCTRNVMLERARCPICQQRIMEYRPVFL